MTTLNGNLPPALEEMLGNLFTRVSALERRRLPDATDSPVRVSSGAFPITEDDGTNTALIDFVSHDLILSNTLDAGSVLKAKLTLFDDGYIDFQAKNGFNVDAFNGASGGGIFFDSNGATSLGNDGGFFVDDDGGGIYLTSQGAYGGVISIQAGSNSYFQATEETGVAEAFMAVLHLAAGVDAANWSKPTFYTLSNDAQNIWDGMVSATVSADLDPSQFGFWLNDTPGSTSINFKAKDSGGTVRTVSIALT